MSVEYTHWQVLVLWAFLGVGVFLVVWYYANRKTPSFVYPFVFIGWQFPFSMVLLLPLDMTSYLYRDCLAKNITLSCEPPVLYVSEQFLFYSWRTIYWTMFLLTFIALPFIISYCDNGYFTVIERTKKSLRANFIYYGILFALGVVAAFWIIVTNQMSWQAMLQFAMSAANIYGLSFLVVFLAYGLTEVPRSMWHKSIRKRMLRQLEVKAPQIREALHAAEAEYDTVCKEIHAISNKTSFEDPLKPFIDIVVAKCPLDRSTGAVPDRVSADYQDLTVVNLAKLHKEIIRAVREKEKCEYEWRQLLEEAFHLQDVITAANDLSTMRFYSPVRKPWEHPLLIKTMPVVEWIWFVYLEPFLYKFVSILFALVSVVIIWSETTYLIPKPIISIVGIIFNISGISYVAIEFLSVTLLLYMCLCAVNSLFRVKVFNMYSLHPNHHTTEVSLCWFTLQLCRFTFPLGYNFMYMASFKNTVLIKFMGDMVGGNLQTFVPILVTVIVLLNVFNVVQRIMTCLGFSDDFMQDEEGGWGDAEEGKMLISEARNNQERSRSAADLQRENLSTGLLANTDSTPQENNGSSSGIGGRQLKDLSQTKSKYLLNNPLYQKYQNKQRK